MTIAEQFQRHCDQFPQNAANRAEFECAMLDEIFVVSTEFHLIHDHETLFSFVFQDGSAMTAAGSEGLHFRILTVKELKTIRKCRHFTEKDLQDLVLWGEAGGLGTERVAGRPPEPKTQLVTPQMSLNRSTYDDQYPT